MDQCCFGRTERQGGIQGQCAVGIRGGSSHGD
jgi:hypothetical protein